MLYTKAFYPDWDASYAEKLRGMFRLDSSAKVKELSQGQRAKAALLTALAHHPPLLLLDEPSAGLDPVVRRDIVDAIIRTAADEGGTMLFSSHLLDEVERVADDVAMIHEGEVVMSAPLEDGSFLEVGFLAVLALFGFALVCWAFLELPLEVMIVAISLELVFVMVWVYVGGDIARTLEFWTSDFVRWSGCIVSVGLIIVTLWILYVASRRKLIDTNTLVCMACAFPAAVASLCAFALWIGMINGWPGLMEGIYIFGLASVPFIPLVIVPQSIAKLRHR